MNFKKKITSPSNLTNCALRTALLNCNFRIVKLLLENDKVRKVLKDEEYYRHNYSF